MTTFHVALRITANSYKTLNKETNHHSNISNLLLIKLKSHLTSEVWEMHNSGRHGPCLHQVYTLVEGTYKENLRDTSKAIQLSVRSSNTYCNGTDQLLIFNSPCRVVV